MYACKHAKLLDRLPFWLCVSANMGRFQALPWLPIFVITLRTTVKWFKSQFPELFNDYSKKCRFLKYSKKLKNHGIVFVSWSSYLWTNQNFFRTIYNPFNSLELFDPKRFFRQVSSSDRFSYMAAICIFLHRWNAIIFSEKNWCALRKYKCFFN